MAGEIDNFLLEKQIGKEFSGRLKFNFLRSIRSKTSKGSGLAQRSTVIPRYSHGFLDRLTIVTPYYIYPILDLGFEGSKGQSFNKRLGRMKDYNIKERKPDHFVSDAFEGGKLIEDLASKVGDNRARSIMAKIDSILFYEKTADEILNNLPNE